MAPSLLHLGSMTKARESARSFTVEETAFFREGERVETTQPIETFTDLDEGYRPLSFWQRLFGKRR